MNLIGRLERVVTIYSEASRLRREQVSYQIFRDQRRLELVFSGRSGLTVNSFERAMEWLSSNWPAAVDWPEGVERPVANQEAAE